MADSPPQENLVIQPALFVQIPESRDEVENSDSNYLYWVSEHTGGMRMWHKQDQSTSLSGEQT